MAETMTLEAPFAGAIGSFLEATLSEARSSGSEFAADAAAVKREEIVADLARLVQLVGSTRGAIEGLASTISKAREIPPDGAASWKGQARRLDERARAIRSVLPESRKAIEESLKNDDFLKEDYMILVDRMEELADRMEDIAETMALAVHKPFREAMKKELEAIGVA